MRAALPIALDELYPHRKGKNRNSSDSESSDDSEDSDDSEFDLDPDIQLMEVKVTYSFGIRLQEF